jgi:hypothetical protein
MQMHEVRYEDLRAAPLPNLMSLLSFLLPTESLPPLEDLACVVELNEEAEAYHSRKSGAFSAWERFSVRISPDGLDNAERFGTAGHAGFDLADDGTPVVPLRLRDAAQEYPGADSDRLHGSGHVGGLNAILLCNVRYEPASRATTFTYLPRNSFLCASLRRCGIHCPCAAVFFVLRRSYTHARPLSALCGMEQATPNGLTADAIVDGKAPSKPGRLTRVARWMLHRAQFQTFGAGIAACALAWPHFGRAN